MQNDEYSSGHCTIGGCDTHRCGGRVKMVDARNRKARVQMMLSGVLSAHAAPRRFDGWQHQRYHCLGRYIGLIIVHQRKGVKTRRLCRVQEGRGS